MGIVPLQNYISVVPDAGMSLLTKAGIAAGAIVGFLFALVGTIWVCRRVQYRRYEHSLHQLPPSFQKHLHAAGGQSHRSFAS